MLLGITLVLALGVGAQWLAWRRGLPAIIVLLTAGFLAGPVLGWVDPNEILGDLLQPFVALAVALILFEGGLSLDISELRGVGRVLRNLLTIGAGFTWLAIAASSWWLLDVEPASALVLGAILVVTGPTVIIPLLRHVRPKPRVNRILKWEGITIDPIGAILAVVLFEAVLGGELRSSGPQIALDMVRSLGIGLAGGLLIAGIVYAALRFYWVPDQLQNAFVVLAVFAGLAVSNELQAESGLVTVTIAGIALASQDRVSIARIREFHEDVRVLVLSSLFILLAASLQIDDFIGLSWRAFVFLGILVLLIRPIAVVLSCLGSQLPWAERAFLAWMAPRGIVAAAVASLFAVDLAEAGVGEPEQLVSLTFLVIVGTVLIYGVTASWVANVLGVQQPPPQGLLFVGAHPWARDIARALTEADIKVLLLDNAWESVRRARLNGLQARHVSALSRYALVELDLSGLGRLVALTPNDHTNALSCLHFREVFGSAAVYQLAPSQHGDARIENVSPGMRGRIIFSEETTFDHLAAMHDAGGRIRVTRLTEAFDFDAFMSHYRDAAVPLFVLSPTGDVTVWAADRWPSPGPGSRIVSMTPPPDRDSAGNEDGRAGQSLADHPGDAGDAG